MSTVLIADDDPDDRAMCAEALHALRPDVALAFAANGEEALACLRAGAARPALVLVDLNMPRRDGREVLAVMKNDPDLCDIPVVVLTTSKSDEDMLRTMAAGASAYVVKPATYQGLLAIAREIERRWLPHAEVAA